MPVESETDEETGQLSTQGDESQIEQSLKITGQVFGPVIQLGKGVVNLVDDHLLTRVTRELRLGILLLIFVIIGSGVTLYLSLRPLSATRKMHGDFRIVVAGFAGDGIPSNSEIAVELAHSVHLRLQEAFEQLNPTFTVTIWGPDRVGSIDGADPFQRTESAVQIAERTGADLIVYGSVDASSPAWQIIPEFYVSSENFYEAAEITGQHDMGAPISIRGQGNIADRIKISSELASRIQTLSGITVGLAYYSVRDFEEALKTFQSIDEREALAVHEGKEVLHILIGNAAAKLGDLNLAEASYREASMIDPEYARAYVGLANMYYRRALGPFEETLVPANVDSHLIDLSIETYERALETARQPPFSDIQTKVHFGLGQAYFTRAYAGDGSRFGPAIAEFRAVIADYGDGSNSRVRELAAESHARLGLIYDLSGHAMRASEEYKLAASLLPDNPERQELFEQRAETLKLRANQSR